MIFRDHLNRIVDHPPTHRPVEPEPAPAVAVADARGETPASTAVAAEILLGKDKEGRMVSLADVTREGLQIFNSIKEFTTIGVAARDDLLALEVERTAKAAGAKPPDLPALRAAVEKGIKSWTGSPWHYSVDEGIRGEIENQATLTRDRARTRPGTLGLATFPKGPGKLAASAPAELLARARACNVDVAAIEGAALAAGMDPLKALEGEVFNQELLASDRTRAVV
ncbi:MAG: hypothetical protein ABSF77_19760 [Spirochaetia bacterium]|jgi:predicted nucleic acid-binding protein